MARCYAAGGVVKRSLIDGADAADEQDKEVFATEMAKYGVTPEMTAEHWERAQRDVERDLRSPAFRRQLWERARELERQLLEMNEDTR
jgi:hypothetical protein